MDIENGHVDTVGKGEGGMNWEIRFDINRLPCVKQIASGNVLYSTGSSAQCSVMTQMWGEKGEGGPRERDYRHTYADSLHCTAETNTTL